MWVQYHGNHKIYLEKEISDTKFWICTIFLPDPGSWIWIWNKKISKDPKNLEWIFKRLLTLYELFNQLFY